MFQLEAESLFFRLANFAMARDLDTLQQCFAIETISSGSRFAENFQIRIPFRISDVTLTEI